jgi:UDP-2,4-diacetamido-2,4,6-trideoxy-beta-L-altropyranose hydrolase
MRIAFRVDASLQIGTGHVMRCLTLADALRAKGAECLFICRDHAGNLLEKIREHGFNTHVLPMLDEFDTGLTHSIWLGATQAQDAQACSSVLSRWRPDWLVVDHYSLDFRWERTFGDDDCRLFVIDDLADRHHECHLLLDQTIGRSINDYKPWLPSHCHAIFGSKYALLRPEFAALREYSLQRRTNSELKNILVNMGGVDYNNATSKALKAVCSWPLPTHCEITVVLGATAPWLSEVQDHALTMPWRTTVRVAAPDMAQLMAESDLAIGAAGTTSWERCCLGLPAIVVVLAENQSAIAQGLKAAGAAIVADDKNPLDGHTILSLCVMPNALAKLSRSAASIVDGLGASRVVEVLSNRIQDANQLAL